MQFQIPKTAIVTIIELNGSSIPQNDNWSLRTTCYRASLVTSEVPASSGSCGRQEPELAAAGAPVCNPGSAMAAKSGGVWGESLGGIQIVTPPFYIAFCNLHYGGGRIQNWGFYLDSTFRILPGVWVFRSDGMEGGEFEQVGVGPPILQILRAHSNMRGGSSQKSGALIQNPNRGLYLQGHRNRTPS